MFCNDNNVPISVIGVSQDELIYRWKTSVYGGFASILYSFSKGSFNTNSKISFPGRVSSR